MKRFASIFFLLCSLAFYSQSDDTLNVCFFIDVPFASLDNSKPTGIEIDIVNDYVLWLKTTKKINIAGVKYSPFTDLDLMISTVKKSGKNTIGLGGMTFTPEKAKEVDFTTGYLKNVAFCISNGNAGDLKVKTAPEIMKVFGSMTAFTIPNTNLSKFVNELKKTYLPELKIVNETDQIKVLDEIAKSVLNFGYVDALEFWFYLKKNPQKFLKMQKPLNQSREELAFIVPKGSNHKASFNEFFSGPAGFKTTRNYRSILEKYIGSYMTQNMAIN